MWHVVFPGGTHQSVPDDPTQGCGDMRGVLLASIPTKICVSHVLSENMTSTTVCTQSSGDACLGNFGIGVSPLNGG